MHGFQIQADFPAEVFALIQRTYVHIARVILRFKGDIAVLVVLEEVEFILSAQLEEVAELACLFHLTAQDGAAIPFKGPTVGGAAVAEHPDDAAGLRPPRQDGEGIRVRHEEQFAVRHVPEALDCGRVKTDAPLKGSRQLRRHNRNILQRAIQIHKRQSDKLHVVLLDVIQHFHLSHKKPPNKVA